MPIFTDHDWLNTFVLLGAFQGFILTAILWKKKNQNKKAIQYLLVLLVITSILLLGKYMYNVGHLPMFLFLLMIYTDAIVLLFGPMIYFFTRSLLKMPLPPRRQMWLHYLPSIIQLTAFNAIIVLSWLEIYPIVSVAAIGPMYYGLEIAAMISFGAYTYFSHQSYIQYEQRFLEKFSLPQLPSFFKPVFTLFAIFLVLWIIGFTLKVSQLFADEQEGLYYAFWISVTLFVYLITYKVLLNPQLLNLPDARMEKEVATAAIPDDIEPLKEKLEQYMEAEKPYLNPSLSLDELAANLNSSRHELSKVINHGFGKNFFDFINAFRVQAFIDICNQLENGEKRTFLEVAFEAGFNSKSAFNRAFRKETKHSPSEYFKLSSSRA